MGKEKGFALSPIRAREMRRFLERNGYEVVAGQHLAIVANTRRRVPQPPVRRGRGVGVDSGAIAPYASPRR